MRYNFNKAEEEYGLDFISKFACLIQGVNIAYDRAEKIGIDTDKSTNWIKPGALFRYIEERHGDMRYDMKCFFEGREKMI